jgi:type IV secretion system protein VirD4
MSRHHKEKTMSLIRLILVATILLATYAVAVGALMIPYGWLVLLVIAIAVLCKKTYNLSAHGTARWADVTDIPHLLEGNGLILGYIDGKPGLLQSIRDVLNPAVPSRIACKNFLMACQRKGIRQIVRLTNAVHTAVFAPTGVGKGGSCVIPFLKTCPDSCVVVDFKGENAQKTAEHRRRKFKHRVVIIDPFKVMTSRPDTFNPLQSIDPSSSTALDECRDLASALVVRTGQEKEPHWNDSAETWIAAMISVVVAYAETADKSLQAVRSLLTNPAKMEAAIRMMCESEMWAGMLARQGHQLAHFKDKELASTLTTTNRFLRFLDTIAVAESTKQSSFNPRDLLNGRMTVYLVLPPEHMRAQSALLRLWIGSLLQAVVKGGLHQKRKVHFVLDEAASLGHMETLDDAVDKYRGYGVRLQFYYQALGQLKECWPEGRDQTLLSNVTQVFFGVNDQQTAQYVSDRLGEETIVVESGGTSSSTSWQKSEQGQGSNSYSSSRNDNWSQMARRLLKPEEVAGLDPAIAITFAPGTPPIWTRLVRYFDKGFRLTHGIGPIKAMLDAVALLAAAAFLAWIVTEALSKSGFPQ